MREKESAIIFVIKPFNLVDMFNDLNIGQLLEESTINLFASFSYALVSILIYTILAVFLVSLVSKIEDVN